MSCATRFRIRQYVQASLWIAPMLGIVLGFAELREQVPAGHRAVATGELARLDATVSRAFSDSADHDRARLADPQRMGGAVNDPSQHALSH